MSFKSDEPEDLVDFGKDVLRNGEVHGLKIGLQLGKLAGSDDGTGNLLPSQDPGQ